MLSNAALEKGMKSRNIKLQDPSIVAGQSCDRESQVSNDCSEPADREIDMRGEHELAEAGCHSHGVRVPANGRHQLSTTAISI